MEKTHFSKSVLVTGFLNVSLICVLKVPSLKEVQLPFTSISEMSHS